MEYKVEIDEFFGIPDDILAEAADLLSELPPESDTRYPFWFGIDTGDMSSQNDEEGATMRGLTLSSLIQSNIDPFEPPILDTSGGDMGSGLRASAMVKVRSITYHGPLYDSSEADAAFEAELPADLYMGETPSTTEETRPPLNIPILRSSSSTSSSLPPSRIVLGGDEKTGAINSDNDKTNGNKSKNKTNNGSTTVIPIRENNTMTIFPAPQPLQRSTTKSSVAAAYEEVKKTLQQLRAALDSREMVITKSEAAQSKVTVQNTDEFARLQQVYFSLHKEVQTDAENLKNLIHNYVLRPVELYESSKINSLIHEQHQKVELLRRELQGLTEETNSAHMATLVIKEQALGQVVFKGRPLDSNYIIKLITGARLNQYEVVHENTKARICEESSWSTDAAKGPLLENNQGHPSGQPSETIYRDIKVNMSTRMGPISLQFVTRIKSKGKLLEVTSVPSAPIIVITNESQWPEAAYRLIDKDMFPSSNSRSIPWPFFCNVLQRHLLTATQQPIDNLRRVFGDADFSYLSERFFGRSTKALSEQVKTCWDWLGHVICTIKFKRYIRPMWYEGLIYSLATKAECKKVLESQSVGDFLIRFSDSAAGQFALSYVTDDPSEAVKHYLVRPEDIGVNRSLADFLLEKTQFRMVVHFTPGGALTKQPKELAFKKWMRKTKRDTADVKSTPEGYVSKLEHW
ncbi:hypothetical protein PROFUN_01113 [Planoprotostelium fungivorum]|uniref:SH2 domain-containing protein n=1 Tax=Planoprotostelium fungivorum TaxID=1890364 RepID=A0A2P6NCB6_9EUKA|nr:hypothetical protein PROFUN_01113 [Planoprotostelium fungivorum]